MIDYNKVKISDVCEINIGNYREEDKWPNFSYLDTSNITEGYIDEIKEFAKFSDLPSRARRKVFPGDIVYSTVRPIQKHYGIIDRPCSNMLVSTGFTVIRAKKDLAETKFVYYFLTLRSTVSKLQTIAEGSTSTYPSIKAEDIGELGIRLPNIQRQRSIIEILSSFDDKIALNKKMNATLEAMAQGLFKSWFVDFDPVKAKLAAVRCGRDPEKAAMAAIACKLVVPPGKPKHDNLEEKLPSAEAIDAAIASLETLSEEQMQSLKEKAAHFPSDFIDSELGLIPLGWEIEKIGNVLDTVLGGTPARKNKDYWENGNVPWINSGKVNEFRVINPTEFITNEALKKSATKLLPNRTTLLAITGATLGQISLNEIPCCANQSVVGVIGNKLISSEYVYQWMNNIIQKLISAQTGGAQQHINKGNVNEASILLPKEPSMIQYNHMVKVIFDLIALKCFENDNLSNLRDALLPKLLSGEISVASD